jgi:hypothetical protein
VWTSGANTRSHRNIALQVGLNDAKCGGAKEISTEREREKIIARHEKELRYAKRGTHTEKTDEALGSFQEGECVDALIGDGDLCEGLRRRGRSGLGEIKRL